MQYGHLIQHCLRRFDRTGAFQPDRSLPLIEPVGSAQLLARIGAAPREIVTAAAADRGKIDERRGFARARSAPWRPWTRRAAARTERSTPDSTTSCLRTNGRRHSAVSSCFTSRFGQDAVLLDIGAVELGRSRSRPDTASDGPNRCAGRG